MSYVFLDIEVVKKFQDDDDGLEELLSMLKEAPPLDDPYCGNTYNLRDLSLMNEDEIEESEYDCWEDAEMGGMCGDPLVRYSAMRELRF